MNIRALRPIQDIGIDIARARLDRRLSIVALGAAANVSFHTVNRLESGGNVSIESFLRIVCILDMDVNKLVFKQEALDALPTKKGAA